MRVYIYIYSEENSVILYYIHTLILFSHLIYHIGPPHSFFPITVKKFQWPAFERTALTFSFVL